MKVELEIEVDTDGESEAPEMPETPAGEETDATIITQEPTAQIRNNQNRLRVAQARRMQFTITNK